MYRVSSGEACRILPPAAGDRKPGDGAVLQPFSNFQAESGEFAQATSYAMTGDCNAGTGRAGRVSSLAAG